MVRANSPIDLALEVARENQDTACVEILKQYELSQPSSSVVSETTQQIWRDDPPPAGEEDVGEIERYFERLPDTEPNFVDIAMDHKKRGNQHFQKKEYQQAIECYTEAIKAHPKDATFYANRSACLMQLRNDQLVPGALHDAQRAIVLRPDWSKAYYRKAVALLELQYNVM